MLQPRIASREASLTTLATALNALALCARHAPKSKSSSPSQPPLTFVRHASHAAQGRANGPKDSAGRRLGAKKTASQWVIPGNIIYKQRGTKWFPGENVGIGKDHTLYSLVHGYVRYYRNPAVHPKRQYIGVALEKEGPGSQLPTPPNAPTRRRLGMYATPIKTAPLSAAAQAARDAAFLEAHVAGGASTKLKTVPTPPPAATQAARSTINVFDPKYHLRHGGYGMANFEIGRALDRAGRAKDEFDRTNRWKAWRVRAAKIKEKMAARAARAGRKSKGKKSNKKIKV